MKKKPLVICLSLAAVCFFGVAVYAAFRIGAGTAEVPPEPAFEIVQTPETGGRGILLTPDTIDAVQAEIERIAEAPTHFTTLMNVHWVFPSGTEPSTNAFVGNSEINETMIYFDVVLSDTDELVFSSPFLPVGSMLDNFTLDVALPPGNYDAVATFFMVNEDFEYLTHVNVVVTIEVLA